MKFIKAVFLIVANIFYVTGSNCGKPFVKPHVSVYNIKRAIHSGIAAVAHSWPWAVGIYDLALNIQCGGSLFDPFGDSVSTRYVLTAAHCIRNMTAVVISVGGYETIISKHDKVFKVRNMRLQTGPDIALMQLAEPVDFNNHVHPVCLPPKDETPIDKQFCYAVGWGGTSEGLIPEVLQQVRLPYIENSTHCGSYPLFKGQMCAGYSNDSRDVCKGDSGGSYMCYNDIKDEWVLYGIVSMGDCYDPTQPGVYVRVASFAEWIPSMVKEMEKD